MENYGQGYILSQLPNEAYQYLQIICVQPM